ncbi:MAG: carboxypeptidase-like regulatory domain-containing protein [Saprospiraceae bacterium]
MKESHNEHGWLELLRKWLSGDATHTDESEMETRARSDEFLAEAIEGYREFPDDDHQWHIDNIRERLLRKKKKRTPVLIYLPRVAAAVLVLVVAWWLLMPVLNPEDSRLARAEDERITETTAPQEEAGQVMEDRADELPSENEDLAAIEQTESQAFPSENTDAGAPTQPEGQPAEPIASREASSGKSQQKGLLPPPATNVETFADTAAPALSADEVAAGNAPAAFEVKGKVVDAESGEALIAAVVQVLGSNKGTVTDVDGSFTLPVPEKNARLLVSYTGYQNEEVTVSPGSPVIVGLQPATDALSEVVVTAEKAPTKRNNIASSSARVGGWPAPKGGWKKWERYLRRKLNYPEEARANGVKGDVVLRFVVGEDGKPSQITVVKSLGSGCDEEAIRLLQNGPKWEPAGSATVSIRFE